MAVPSWLQNMGLGLTPMAPPSGGAVPSDMLTPQQRAQLWLDQAKTQLPTEGEERKSGAKFESDKKKTEVFPVPEEVYDTVRNRVITNPLPGMHELDKRGDDIAGGLGALVNYGKEVLQRPNLAPMGDLLRTWYGGDIGKSYTPPEDRALALGKLGEGLASTLGTLTGKRSDAELSFLEKNLKDRLQTGNADTLSSGVRNVSGTLANSGMDDIIKALAIMTAKAEMPGAGTKTAPNPSQYTIDRNATIDAEKKAAALDKKITDFTNHRDKFYPSIVTALGSIDGIIAKNDGRVPGYVNIGNGRYELPFDFLKSEEGKSVARNNATILSAVTNRYSGAASSEQEARRIAAGLGQKFAQGEQQYKEALRDLARAIRQAESDREKALGKDAYDELKNRGITTSDAINFTFGLEPTTPAPKTETKELGNGDLDKLLEGK